MENKKDIAYWIGIVLVAILLGFILTTCLTLGYVLIIKLMITFYWTLKQAVMLMFVLATLLFLFVLAKEENKKNESM